MDDKTKRTLLWIAAIIIVILLLKGCDESPLSVSGGGSSSGGSGGGANCPVCPSCDNPRPPTIICDVDNGVCTDSLGTHRNACDGNVAVNYACGINGYCLPTNNDCTGSIRAGSCYFDTAYMQARCIY